jgi:pimeloyl-ACP methyl ester carboxylesterase
MVRLLQLTAPEANNAGVVLVGHGQGSVLAAATVLQLPDHVRERVALLTVGSPLHRLYTRLFPAYLNEHVLATLARGLTTGGTPVRWINLWRATDPIGGPVGLPNVDRELTDPVGFEFSPELGHHPSIGGNVRFEEDPAFAVAVVELAGRLAPGTAVPPDGAPGPVVPPDGAPVPVVPAPRRPS